MIEVEPDRPYNRKTTSELAALLQPCGRARITAGLMIDFRCVSMRGAIESISFALASGQLYGRLTTYCWIHSSIPCERKLIIESAHAPCTSAT